MQTILAVDVMGGDDAPRATIHGVALAAKKFSDLFFFLFGDEEAAKPFLETYPVLENRYIFTHTDEVVSNTTPVVQALRSLKRSGMRLAIESVVRQEAHAVVSAGNTGAYMALSKILLKTLEGVERPAIAALLPTLGSPCVALDLGANVACTSDNLLQFAVMGDVMARHLLGANNPRLGLLNVGVEELKGNEIVQLASQKIKEKEGFNFHGFVEGNDFTSGVVDVLITDGFTGNVALKTIEGTVKFMVKTLQSFLESSTRGKLGYIMAKPALMEMKEKMDPRLYNGAVFLGLKGIAVKSHGGADEVGFANALSVAYNMVRHRETQDIKEEIIARLN